MKAVDLQINLLPWRQKRREYQQRQLVNALALVALVGGFLLVVWWQIQSSQIAKQDERNALLKAEIEVFEGKICLLYTSPSPRDLSTSRMPSSA